MNLTNEQLKEILQRPGIAASNPGLVGLASDQRKPHSQPALDGNAKAQPQVQRSVAWRVRIVVFRRTLFDDDNSISGLKCCRDYISRSLGIDDGDDRIKFEYAQMKTDGPQGTLVAVHQLQDLSAKKL